MKKFKKTAATVLAVLLLAASVTVFTAGFRYTTEQHVTVLMYHSVSNAVGEAAQWCVTPRNFDQQMKYLADHGYTFLDLNEIKDCAKYKKPIVITFDDGYKDNYTNAYPILKKYNIKATVFMVAGYVGRGAFMTSDQIKEMGDLVSFQSHTIKHKRLDTVDEASLESECRDSKKTLEDITGKPVYALSYPNGRYNDAVIGMARKYYDCAVTTDSGTNVAGSNPYTLSRVNVLHDENIADFEARLS